MSVQVSQAAKVAALKSDESAVDNYLTRHPELAAVLPSIIARIRNDFPSGQLSLELYRDLEINDHYLTLYVRQQSYGNDIIERLEQISDEFSSSLEQGSGYLLLTTDFRSA